MNDLVTFLRARYDAEELRAKVTESGPDWRSTGYGTLADRDVDGWNAGSDAAHIASFRHEGDADHAALWSPDKVLREVAAKRKVVDEYADALRILDGFRETGWEEGRREALKLACKALAVAHADHPDFKESWKP